jgi:hypothetical protein
MSALRDLSDRFARSRTSGAGRLRHGPSAIRGAAFAKLSFEGRTAGTLHSIHRVFRSVLPYLLHGRAGQPEGI